MVSRCVRGRVVSEVDEGIVEPVRASVWPSAGAELAVAMVDTTDMIPYSKSRLMKGMFVEDAGCRAHLTWTLETMSGRQRADDDRGGVGVDDFAGNFEFVQFRKFDS